MWANTTARYIAHTGTGCIPTASTGIITAIVAFVTASYINITANIGNIAATMPCKGLCDVFVHVRGTEVSLQFYVRVKQLKRYSYSHTYLKELSLILLQQLLSQLLCLFQCIYYCKEVCYAISVCCVFTAMCEGLVTIMLVS